MKRNGFMSIEMLLIIGVVVAALAGVFLMYNKITRSTASMKVTEDIASLVSALDRYKGATGGYPSQLGGGAIVATANTWNAGNLYIDAGLTGAFNYSTDEATVDGEGNGVGNAIITVNAASYPALNPAEITDILRMKCMNGKKTVSGIAAIGSSAAAVQCVIASNTPIFRQP